MSKVTRSSKWIAVILAIALIIAGIAFYKSSLNPMRSEKHLQAAEETKNSQPAQSPPAAPKPPGKSPDAGSPPPAKPSGPAVQAVEVEVVPVKTHPVQRTVDFVGTLFAFEESVVSSEVDGRVEKVTVDLGDTVKKGDLLVKIHDDELRLAVEGAIADLKQTMAKLGLDGSEKGNIDIKKTTLVTKAKADMDNAELNLSRLKKLLADKLVPQQQVDDAETKYQVAKANYNAALEDAKVLLATIDAKKVAISLEQAKLSHTNVVAPINGEVLSKKVSTGEYVKVGTPLITLVDSSQLKLRGDIPERFSTQIYEGQEVRLTVDAVVNETFSGKISRISPASNPETRAVTVEALIPNPDKKLKPGFFAKAAVLTQSDDKALAVPQEALVTFAGVTKVFVIADNKAVERIVQKGMTLGTDVEIIHGVNSGEVVAVSGLSKLHDGAPVVVKASSSPEAKASGQEKN